MRTTKHYLALERRIAAADGRGVIARWQWGRDLLSDPAAVTPTGALRRGLGTVESLIESARREGLSLSEREIQYRLRCARSYSTEAQVATALRLTGSWRGLIAAGFPPVEVDEPEAEPLIEGTFDELLPDAMVVDGAVVPRALAPLRVAIAFHAERKRKTAVKVRRDEACDAWLEQLVDAAAGDIDVTIGDAESRLRTKAAGE